MQGIGSLLLGIAALGGFVLTILKGGKVLEMLRERGQIISERNDALTELDREHRTRVAAEARASNWEDAAHGAQFDLEAMEVRINDLEKAFQTLQTRLGQSERFVRDVANYTRDVLIWAVNAEATARRGGIQLAPIPPIPDVLADRLQMPAVEA